MFWRMFQNGVPRFDVARSQDFMRNIWLSDGSMAVPHLFSQRCTAFEDGTILIFGKVDLSSYLSDDKALKLSGRTNLMFRVGLSFERQFFSPPAVSVTGNILRLGVKHMQERRFVPQVSDVTIHGCEVIVELAEAKRALEGLYVNWTAIGSIGLNRFKASQ